ncbi:NADPH-ferrihemoprotein reductase [Rhizoctonia solani AG-1 IB]|uniref:NADPH-ferrihemoprotein reductase n=1 Tax=Thanatephorus cucumeris (strain AG1-IB / isolate 7/3/14) TaxID=1108050 RepID=A0A0B7FXC8_THACB|nr:NADPH-ferrihemoprotein reductase [Rhizoctonia solani AG-1 IB]
MTTPIPQPPAIPFFGNVTEIDAELPSRSLTLLARQYGEIFALNLLGKSIVGVSSVKLAQEVLDDKRFHKAIGAPLAEVRNLVSDGLFTAYHGETNWGIAHRILMPVFSPLSTKGMFDDMFEVISQLVLKWERFGPEHEIDPTDDFTRLAFETIALCTFNYRLNTFYTEGEPPFVKAMSDFLKECFLRSRRPTIVQALSYGANAKYAADMDIMNDLANKIVKDRKDHPSDKKDLLNAMLFGKDPQTGMTRTERGEYQGAAADVPDCWTRNNVWNAVFCDDACNEEPGAVLRESLRVTPSIGQFTVTPHKDEVIGDGKYLIKKGTVVMVLAGDVGQDPAVWGEDADKFNPDRMLDGKFEALPPKAWIPFGNGARACIGRPFAWQEALITIATIFQKFDFKPSDESYTLQLKQMLTMKPKDFRFHAIPRKGAPSFSVAAASSQATNGPIPGKEVVDGELNGTPLYVFYGSNTGSCEGFAQSIASEAAGKGYRATIGTLNSIVGNIPKDGPVVILTASFEGVVTQGQFLGVASNYLGSLRKGDRVQMSVRPSSKGFHPPTSPEVPMVLFAAGSGLAPFRGFIQERAMQKQGGREVGKCVLFFGCRNPDEDFLYGSEELGEWEGLGVVDVRPAFSRAAEKSEGQKYVQDRVWNDREVVREYFNKGAKFYTCGGSNVATGIRDACVRIIAEGKDDATEERLQEIWNKLQAERYATDVFG